MNNYKKSRRNFLKNTMAATAFLATTNPFKLEAKDLPFWRRQTKFCRGLKK